MKIKQLGAKVKLGVKIKKVWCENKCLRWCENKTAWRENKTKVKQNKTKLKRQIQHKIKQQLKNEKV